MLMESGNALRFTFIKTTWKHPKHNQSIQTKTNVQSKTEE